MNQSNKKWCWIRTPGAVAIAAVLGLGLAQGAMAQSYQTYSGQAEAQGPQGWNNANGGSNLPSQWKDWHGDDPSQGQPPGPRAVPADADWQNQPTTPRGDGDWNPGGPRHPADWNQPRPYNGGEQDWHGQSGWGHGPQNRGDQGMGGMGMHVREQNGIRYLTGGVALDESTRLKAERNHWPLSIMYTGPGGEYLADVHVRISRGGEEVAHIRTEGPFLLVKLPPGRYWIESQYSGHSSKRAVQVGGPGSARLSVYFPSH